MIDDEDHSQPRVYYKADVLAQIAEDRAEDERRRIEREAWLETHYVPDRSPPEPEPQPRVTAKPTRHSMDERERHNLANYIRCTVEREVAAALRRERAELADAIGKAIAAERAQSRKLSERIESIEQRAASLERREFFESLAERISTIEARGARAADSDATVLDLSDERRRRAGE